MSETEFIKASENDIDEITLLVSEAVKAMESEGIFQWDELYPTSEDFLYDIRKGSLYIGKISGETAVVFSYNSESDEEYIRGNWHNENYMVVHRLCVRPRFQHQGVGRKTMKYIENNLTPNGVGAIRLDAFSENPYSQKLYKSLGFRVVGDVYWRKGLFYLMEKVL